MRKPSCVLIISNDHAIRNILEQVFMVGGYTPVTTETIKEAEAIQARVCLATFALIVIDTAVLEELEDPQQRRARRLLRDWTAAYPGLPFLFIGTVLQKYALLAVHDAIVPFVTKPFKLHELVDAVRTLLPST